MLSYYVINSSQTSAKNCLEVEQEQQSIQSQYDRWGHHLPPLQVHIVSEGCCQAEYPAQMMADSVLYSQLPGPLVLQDTDSHTLQSVGLLACCQCNLKSHEQLYQGIVRKCRPETGVVVSIWMLCCCIGCAQCRELQAVTPTGAGAVRVTTSPSVDLQDAIYLVVVSVHTEVT